VIAAGHRARLAWTLIIAIAFVASVAIDHAAGAGKASEQAPGSVGGQLVRADRPSPSTPSIGISPYIVGGSPAQSAAWPYLDDINVLTSTGAFACTGDRIAANWVLTAQHCLVDSGTNALVAPGSVQVGLGVGPDQTRTDWQVPAQIVAFPGYDPTTHFGDIALLKLLSSAPDTQVVNLARASDEPSSRPALVGIAGWGATSDGGPPVNFPEYAGTYLWSQAFCSSQWIGFDPTYELCAGGPDGSGHVYAASCEGDSGGPLVSAPSNDLFDEELLGTTDFVAAAGCQVAPPVYERISYYYSWLISQTGLGPVPVQSVRESSKGFNRVTLDAWIPPNEANGIVELVNRGHRVVSQQGIIASSRVGPVYLSLSGLSMGTHYSGYSVVTISHYGDITFGGVGFSTAGKADLSISLHCATLVERIGHRYACRAVVHNAGPDTAGQVTVYFTARPAARAIACTVAGLRSRRSTGCSMNVRPSHIGHFSYTASVSSAAVDPNHRNNSVSVRIRVRR